MRVTFLMMPARADRTARGALANQPRHRDPRTASRGGGSCKRVAITSRRQGRERDGSLDEGVDPRRVAATLRLRRRRSCSCICSAGASSSTTRATTRRSPASARSPTRSGCGTPSTPTTSRRSTTRRASSSRTASARWASASSSRSATRRSSSRSRPASRSRRRRSTRGSRASRDYGGYVGASVSGTFLLLIGILNLRRAARHPRRLPADAARPLRRAEARGGARRTRA